MEVGGLVGLPQTPLALLLFLPDQFDDVYVKIELCTNFTVGTSQTGAVYILASQLAQGVDRDVPMLSNF